MGPNLGGGGWGPALIYAAAAGHGRLVARGLNTAFYYLGGLAAAVTVWYQLLAEAHPPGAAGKPEKRDWGEWGIFAVPTVHSFLGYFFAKGAAELMMLQTAPIFFVERFCLSPIEAGAYIAAAKTINVPASFFTGEHHRRRLNDRLLCFHTVGAVFQESSRAR